jgi:hypothetical protein
MKAESSGRLNQGRAGPGHPFSIPIIAAANRIAGTHWVPSPLATRPSTLIMDNFLSNLAIQHISAPAK